MLHALLLSLDECRGYDEALEEALCTEQKDGGHCDDKNESTQAPGRSGSTSLGEREAGCSDRFLEVIG